MKQEISALMDGELYEDEATILLDRMKRDPAAGETWMLYQIIGDALRQPDHLRPGFGAAFRERLAMEPTVLAPRHIQRPVRYFALSAAASVVALALVAWLSLQVGSEPAPQIAAMPQPAVVQPVSYSASEYLLAHQEVVPGINVQGSASYIRAVADR